MKSTITLENWLGNKEVTFAYDSLKISQNRGRMYVNGNLFVLNITDSKNFSMKSGKIENEDLIGGKNVS